jgi:hypothetical protein
MRGANAYIHIEGMEVGTIKNLCIEGTTANRHVHRFERCSNVRVCDLYTEVLGVADPSVPIVDIGPRCTQMEFYNCRFTMHREKPKSEYLVDVAPGSHNILFNRCRVNRVDRPYPKIRNRSTAGVVHFNACTFAKIGTYEGLLRFTSPQLSWSGTRPIVTRDPRIETLCRAGSTVVTHNLVTHDSDFNKDVHFRAVKGSPRITLQKTGGYGDERGCVTIEGKKGDVVELDPDHWRPFSQTYWFPFWMMRSQGTAAVEFTSSLSFGKYHVPMPVLAHPHWQLYMIVNAQTAFDGMKKPSWRLTFNQPGAVTLDRIHAVQSPFYTPSIWDDYKYVPSP